MGNCGEEMIMPKISVIIPVYNVEKYLRRCLDSVIRQTYKNLEIICVNDCSPDGSLTILEEYAAKDTRIKIISHAQNHGLSAARNTGMDAARGEYVYFIDSDDWIDLNYLECMMIAASHSGTKMVMNTNIRYEFEDGRTEKFYQEINPNKIGFIPALENLEKISHTSWSYLFEKNFLDSINARFPEGLCHEDVYFQRTTMVYLDSIYLINSPVYHYTRRNSSITGALKEKCARTDIIDIVERIYGYYCKYNFLDRVNIPFFYIMYRFDSFLDKKASFVKMKKLFIRIKDDVIGRSKLYKDDDLLYFNIVLFSDNFAEFNSRYWHELKGKRIFPNLREKIKKQKEI